jgi:Transposase, Mutator family
MVSETPANGSRERTQRTVALDQSALLEVLEVLKAADVDDRIRQAAQTIYQALIEAELTSVIGAAPHQRTQTGRGSATGTGRGSWRPPPGIWSCGSPSYAPGRSSRACWSGAAGSIRPCSRW